MFQEVIKRNEKRLEYHQTKARRFLWCGWFLACLVLVVVLFFAGYMQSLLDDVAITHVQVSQELSKLQKKEFEPPDFVGLINENYFGYWAVPGFVLILFASIGLLKHHTSRASSCEEKLSNLYMLQAVSEIDDMKQLLVNGILESAFRSGTADENRVVLNPIFDSATENAKKIIDKVTS